MSGLIRKVALTKSNAFKPDSVVPEGTIRYQLEVLTEKANLASVLLLSTGAPGILIVESLVDRLCNEFREQVFKALEEEARAVQARSIIPDVRVLL